MPGKTFRRIHKRQVLLGIVGLAVACGMIANLGSAVMHGEVFLVRGGGPASFSDEPIKFLMSIVVSLVTAFVSAGLGWMLIASAREEGSPPGPRSARPKLEEPSYRSQVER